MEIPESFSLLIQTQKELYMLNMALATLANLFFSELTLFSN